MDNRYPLWKYLILLVAIVAGGLYALPNVFGEDPALQITQDEPGAPSQATRQRVLDVLDEAGIQVTGSEIREERLVVRLPDSEAQLKGVDEVAVALDSEYSVAMALAPRTPAWLRSINARPMYLGLDLRGGVHFLMDVDLEAALDQQLDRYQREFRNRLREADVRYSRVKVANDTVRVAFERAPEREKGSEVLIGDDYRELDFRGEASEGTFWLVAELSDQEVRELEQNAVEQNITTLRDRVNQLGVSEPVIQRQGRGRIVVQLPGIQDTTQAKEIIGATATLEFHQVNTSAGGQSVGPNSDVPADTRVYPIRDGGHVALYRETILTGEYITDAQAGLSQDTSQPEVRINLNSAGGDLMERFTKDHVGDGMATVFIDKEIEVRREDGEIKREPREVEEVINVATIQAVLGSTFRITGLSSSREARNLALLLRAGSLAAPMQIVEERTIGPSLGQDNINQGFAAVVLGFLLVVAFMAVYYRVFGLFANVALFLNLVFIIAILSVLQATLTLPGIAGIVLTVGMAVDANVLIFERIREELKQGSTSQAAIASGYGKALSTIADANITTLIAAVVLFVFGTGPIKGFAVTLSIGIVTSMFTAIMGTRALVALVYGGRSRVKLAIG
jgi:preprotein translocase subunit SecD